MDVALVGAAAALCIAAVTAFASQLGVAAPLLLVLVGVVVSLVPGIPTVDIDPKWVLIGVLPPLLYSASVSMPTMDVRRDFRAIGSLSVVLVVISSVVVGAFLAAVVPGIELSTGIALGAIISPTDAVATTIVKKLGVSPRTVTVLQGESLLNDATALVLLRSAVAAAGVSVSMWGVAWDFVVSVAIAVIIGLLVGRLSLLVRRRITDSAVNTAISFTVPFVAYLPAEHLNASGLVAAVAAGLYTGQAAPRYLSPRHRLSEEQKLAHHRAAARRRRLPADGAGAGRRGLGRPRDARRPVVRAVDRGGRGRAGGADPGGVRRSAALRAAPRGRTQPGLPRAAHHDADPARRRHPARPGAARPAAAHRAPDPARGAAHREAHRALPHPDPARDRRRRLPRRRPAGLARGHRAGLGRHARRRHPGGRADAPRGHSAVLAAGADRVRGRRGHSGRPGRHPADVGLPARPGVAARRRSRPRERELLAELSAAARAALEDPDLRRPDGTPYDAAVLERPRMATMVPASDDEQLDGRKRRRQFTELRLQLIAAMRESLPQARSDGTYSSETLEGALAILDAEQITAGLRG